MSAQSVSFDDHPPHGHPENRGPSTQKDDKPSTASHPPPTKPDPTTTAPHPKVNPQGTTFPGNKNESEGRVAAATTSSTSQLANLEIRLRRAIRQYPDFPQQGILFEDILPIFASPQLHADLLTALELRVKQEFSQTPDVIVALESRGFLFGPALALRIGASFVPVRKKGKLPGDVETEAFEKEYGSDYFQIQKDSIKKGQKVVVVDDLIATGGSAVCAGNLVQKLGGELMGFMFLMELGFLKGRDKLGAPCHTLLSGQDSKEEKDDIDAKLPLGRTKEAAEDIRPVKDAGGSGAETRP